MRWQTRVVGYLSWMLWLVCGVPGRAWAGGAHVVRAGETIATIAAQLGHAGSEAELRRRNQMTSDQEPKVGQVLELPADWMAVVCRPSYARRVSNGGTVARPDGTVLPLVEGSLLPEGARVCTSEQGFAAIRISLGLEQDVWDDVVLMNNTCVRIRTSFTTSSEERSLVTLEQGGLTVVEPGRQAGEVAVSTGQTVSLGVGGFRVRREESVTITEALDRSVVALSNGAEVEVDAGFGTSVTDGEVPMKAVALTGGPELLAPAPHETMWVPEFSWADVPRAVAFVITIASDAEFTNIVFQDNAGANLQYAPDDLMLPLYEDGAWWRVTSVDRTGLQGVPSEPRHLVFPSVTGR